MIKETLEIADIFMGFGESYPKSAILDFLVSTGKNRKEWNNKSDAIYFSYHEALTKKGYQAWTPENGTQSARTVQYVTDQTGLPQNDVYTYLLTLYTMAKMGKIKTAVWNPSTGTVAYSAGQAAEAIKSFISPVTTVAAAPTKSLITGLTIAAALTLIGIFASKEFIKDKTLSRGRK